MTGFPPPL